MPLSIGARNPNERSAVKKQLFVPLAVASLSVVSSVNAITLDDIPFWTGTGTNRAALVLEWSTPESAAYSSVPAPIADKTMVWGYRFNGAPNATAMLNAILAADPRFYAVEDNTYGTFVEGFGYNLSGDGVIGITDGTTTNYITHGALTAATVDVDAARPINGGDLYWAGLYGPNWETWNEAGDAGGFLASPNRGTNQYWTADDISAPYSGVHGQWEISQNGLDGLLLTNGSWIGFSVAAGEYESATNAPYNLHKHAPPSPAGTTAAYVANANDFGAQVVSSSGVYTTSPYNDPAAVLGRPTLTFYDYYGTRTTNRVKIVEPPYWTDANGNKVITEISNGGQITVKLGRKVYDDPNNPYGVDFIIYGNSFFSASGGGAIKDSTDLDIATLSSGFYGHPTLVSVSQDGTNWFTFTNNGALYPDNAYRWDATNHAWTDEQLNPTKPLNPSIYGMNFGGTTAASALDEFTGAAGGTGFDLKQSGLPWIQYVRVQPVAGTYTVIDSIAAVNPTVVGDALAITPDNLANGITNLVFQQPANSSQSLIALNFDSISDVTRVGTLGLGDLSAYAPISTNSFSNVAGAYQITLKSVAGDSAVNALADVSLSPGAGYHGNGADLHVFQWNGAGWDQPAFTYNATTRMVQVSQVTNFTAFVIGQLPPVNLKVQLQAGSVTLSFKPIAGWQHVVERSTDLVNWTPVATNTPADTQTVTVSDGNAPAGKAFYRVQLSQPNN